MKHLTPLADSTDRAAWLEARRPTTLITASQISAIVGSNPYTKLIDVWNEKHDPEWTEDRNWALDMRAAYGTEQEPHLIEWASSQKAIGGKLTPNTTLYENPERPGTACTPDAYRYSRRGGQQRLILVDAKTTETDWEAKGVPQHIIDQMLWQWYVTECDEIWLAVQRVKWTKGQPTVLGRYLYPVPLDEAAHVRLAFLLERRDEFLHMVNEGIAPESDIDIREVGFDTHPEDARLWAEVDAAMNELADIDARIEADLARRAELDAKVKAGVKEYHGRRVHLIGTRKVAKLVRYWKAVPDMSRIDQRAIAAATTWRLDSRVVIDDNPEYQAAKVDG